MELANFICKFELAAMNQEHKARALELLEAAPQLYAQDGKGDSATIALHYFKGASDWYLTELDTETGEGFGFVILNGWTDCAELGYVYIPELIANGVEFDIYWDASTTLETIRAEIAA